MPAAPAFWSRDGILPTILSPLSKLVAAVTARRVARSGWRAPVPVICCGNVTVGGAGKTTLAIDLASRLVARGLAVHILLRGYGGSSRGPRRVMMDDPATLVGDEALLLARIAPTWIGADRAASARLAVAAGARVLLMDDGLQNPGLAKDLSILVIDGESGFGNGRVLPAGPLREPVAAGAARCQVAVLIGDDTAGAAVQLPPNYPVLRARLVQDQVIDTIKGHPVLAIAGIARPAKFFDALVRAGVQVVETREFPDHHPFTRAELEAVLRRGAESGAVVVTTPKDAVRLPLDLRARFTVVGVRLDWDDPARVDGLLTDLIAVERS
jgi:tetraacyldisaccharide 4'-kinase